MSLLLDRSRLDVAAVSIAWFVQSVAGSPTTLARKAAMQTVTVKIITATMQATCLIENVSEDNFLLVFVSLLTLSLLHFDLIPGGSVV